MLCTEGGGGGGGGGCGVLGGGVLRILSDGMIQGYFRFEMFDSWIFQLGWENLASIFWVVLSFKS